MKELKKQINKLSAAEKIVLVENIWDSISDSHFEALTDQEKKELDRRLELIKSGKAKFSNTEELKRKFKQLK